MRNLFKESHKKNSENRKIIMHSSLNHTYGLCCFEINIKEDISLKERKAFDFLLPDLTCQACAFSLVNTREQVLSRNKEVKKLTTFQIAYKILK